MTTPLNPSNQRNDNGRNGGDGIVEDTRLRTKTSDRNYRSRQHHDFNKAAAASVVAAAADAANSVKDGKNSMPANLNRRFNGCGHHGRSYRRPCSKFLRGVAAASTSSSASCDDTAHPNASNANVGKYLDHRRSSSPPPPCHRLHVSNLHHKVTWQILRDHVHSLLGNDKTQEIGHMKVCVTVDGTLKGYGIVEFPSADSARRAMLVMQGTLVQGCPIHVREENRRDFRSHSHVQQSSTPHQYENFVRDIPSNERNPHDWGRSRDIFDAGDVSSSRAAISSPSKRKCVSLDDKQSITLSRSNSAPPFRSCSGNGSGKIIEWQNHSHKFPNISSIPVSTQKRAAVHSWNAFQNQTIQQPEKQQSLWQNRTVERSDKNRWMALRQSHSRGFGGSDNVKRQKSEGWEKHSYFGESVSVPSSSLGSPQQSQQLSQSQSSWVSHSNQKDQIKERPLMWPSPRSIQRQQKLPPQPIDEEMPPSQPSPHPILKKNATPLLSPQLSPQTRPPPQLTLQQKSPQQLILEKMPPSTLPLQLPSHLILPKPAPHIFLPQNPSQTRPSPQLTCQKKSLQQSILQKRPLPTPPLKPTPQPTLQKELSPMMSVVDKTRIPQSILKKSKFAKKNLTTHTSEKRNIPNDNFPYTSLSPVQHHHPASSSISHNVIHILSSDDNSSCDDPPHHSEVQNNFSACSDSISTISHTPSLWSLQDKRVLSKNDKINNLHGHRVGEQNHNRKWNGGNKPFPKQQQQHCTTAIHESKQCLPSKLITLEKSSPLKKNSHEYFHCQKLEKQKQNEIQSGRNYMPLKQQEQNCTVVSHQSPVLKLNESKKSLPAKKIINRFSLSSSQSSMAIRASLLSRIPRKDVSGNNQHKGGPSAVTAKACTKKSASSRVVLSSSACIPKKHHRNSKKEERTSSAFLFNDTGRQKIQKKSSRIDKCNKMVSEQLKTTSQPSRLSPKQNSSCGISSSTGTIKSNNTQQRISSSRRTRTNGNRNSWRDDYHWYLSSSSSSSSSPSKNEGSDSPIGFTNMANSKQSSLKVNKMEKSSSPRSLNSSLRQHVSNKNLRHTSPHNIKKGCKNNWKDDYYWQFYSSSSAKSDDDSSFNSAEATSLKKGARVGHVLLKKKSKKVRKKNKHSSRNDNDEESYFYSTEATASKKSGILRHALQMEKPIKVKKKKHINNEDESCLNSEEIAASKKFVAAGYVLPNKKTVKIKKKRVNGNKKIEQQKLSTQHAVGTEAVTSPLSRAPLRINNTCPPKSIEIGSIIVVASTSVGTVRKRKSNDSRDNDYYHVYNMQGKKKRRKNWIWSDPLPCRDGSLSPQLQISPCLFPLYESHGHNDNTDYKNWCHLLPPTSLPLFGRTVRCFCTDTSIVCGMISGGHVVRIKVVKKNDDDGISKNNFITKEKSTMMAEVCVVYLDVTKALSGIFANTVKKEEEDKNKKEKEKVEKEKKEEEISGKEGEDKKGKEKVKDMEKEDEEKKCAIKYKSKKRNKNYVNVAILPEGYQEHGKVTVLKSKGRTLRFCSRWEIQRFLHPGQYLEQDNLPYDTNSSKEYVKDNNHKSFQQNQYQQKEVASNYAPSSLVSSISSSINSFDPVNVQEQNWHWIVRHEAKSFSHHCLKDHEITVGKVVGIKSEGGQSNIIFRRLILPECTRGGRQLEFQHGPFEVFGSADDAVVEEENEKDGGTSLLCAHRNQVMQTGYRFVRVPRGQMMNNFVNHFHQGNDSRNCLFMTHTYSYDHESYLPYYTFNKRSKIHKEKTTQIFRISKNTCHGCHREQVITETKLKRCSALHCKKKWCRKCLIDLNKWGILNCTHHDSQWYGPCCVGLCPCHQCILKVNYCLQVKDKKSFDNTTSMTVRFKRNIKQKAMQLEAEIVKRCQICFKTCYKSSDYVHCKDCGKIVHASCASYENFLSLNQHDGKNIAVDVQNNQSFFQGIPSMDFFPIDTNTPHMQLGGIGQSNHSGANTRCTYVCKYCQAKAKPKVIPSQSVLPYTHIFRNLQKMLPEQSPLDFNLDPNFLNPFPQISSTPDCTFVEGDENDYNADDFILKSQFTVMSSQEEYCSRCSIYDKKSLASIMHKQQSEEVSIMPFTFSNIQIRSVRDIYDRSGSCNFAIIANTSALPTNSSSIRSRAARLNQRRMLKDDIFHQRGLGLLDTLSGREAKLRFGRSAIHAWGVFADEDIKADSMIIEYRGELIGNAVADLRERLYEKEKLCDYQFRIDATTVCDATMRGGLARYINASCDPNCYTQIICQNEKKRIVIYAKRDITAGEELCYDYKFSLELNPAKRIPCGCNSRDCRGYMNWDKKLDKKFNFVEEFFQFPQES